MYRTFLFPSGSSAFSHLKKAIKSVHPEVQVLYWVYIQEGNQTKTRLCVYNPAIQNNDPLFKQTDVCLEIYREKVSKSRQVIVKFKLPQFSSVPMNFEAIAQALEDQQTIAKLQEIDATATIRNIVDL